MDIEEFYKTPHLLEENKYNEIKLGKLKTFFPQGQRVLDYGCGDGTVTKMISELNNAIGVDVSKKSVEICRKKGLDARLIQVEKKLAFASGSFDCIFCLETIEHVFDTESMLNEFRRLLKKNGSLVVSTPNVAQLSNRARFLLDLPLRYVETKIEAGHIRFFTKNSLEKLLEENGFRVEKTVSNFVYIPAGGPVSFLGDVFPSLGTELIVKAAKK
ncbi:MAG: class I SAM-dependent methyltransferase [archaeon]